MLPYRRLSVATLTRHLYSVIPGLRVQSEKGEQMPRSAVLSVLLMLVLAGGAGAQTVSSTTGAIDGKVTDTSNAVLPGVTVTHRQRSDDGHPRHGHERHRHVPVRLDHPGPLHRHVRAAGLRDREAHRRAGRRRLHRDAEHLDARRRPRGSGHRDRRLAGRRYAGDEDLDELRLAEAGGDAERQQRPVGDAGGNAGRQDEPHRRRRQRGRHAGRLHGVRHRRPAAVLRRASTAPRAPAATATTWT